MITADKSTLLGELCADIDAMKPGDAFTADRSLLREIPTFWHNDAQFTPADRILGNIVGSAYTHSYSVDSLSGNITFYRHENTGKLYYADPDRR